MGPHYVEMIRTNEETREIDDLYKMTVTPEDYINPTDDGTLSWHCASSCTLDSKEGHKNWQNRLHKVLGR